MKMKASCIYSIIQALQARKEWIIDDSDNLEELPFIIEALELFHELEVEIEISENKEEKNGKI